MSDRLNWSTLRHIATSPKLMAWRAEHPREDTAALKLGRAIHCAILEPDEFAGRWISTGPCAAVKKDGGACGSGGSLYLDGRWYCRVKGHAPAGAGIPPAGIEVLEPSEIELATICAEAVRAHKVAADLLKSGSGEQALEWQDERTGILCKGRLDYLRPGFLVDLKSTRRESLREIVMDAARNLYHGQLAWYHDGAIASGRIPPDAEMPYIIAVSTTEPYDVAAFQLSVVTYQAGQILYRDLLTKYQQCQAAGYWPGIAPDLVEMDLPNWASGMRGSEEESTEDNW